MRVLVVGFGAFASAVARTLLATGHEVIVVERDGELVDRFASLATRAVVGDATDPDVLDRAGARSADAAVIGTSENLATTILATLALRDLGVERIYAKVASLMEARALDQLGVTESVFPEHEAGDRLAHAIVSRDVLRYTELAPGWSLQEIAVPGEWTGRSLLEIEPRSKHGVQVVAVRDALTTRLSLPPDPAARLKPSDSLLVAGSDAELSRLCEPAD